MNIAMIGAGGYARAHLNVLEKEADVTIVGHVSPTAASREAAARRYGGCAYASCDALLNSEQVDAAWISVPPHVHGEIETFFIERTIPFFVEKPLSNDWQTAKRIADRLPQNLIVAVGYKFRAISTLTKVRTLLLMLPPRLMQAAWHGGTPGVRWWQRQEMSGGQMVEQATHLIDLARYLLGEAKVTSATATCHARPDYPELNVATTSAATLEFERGVMGYISATCLLEGGRDIYLKLVCDGLLITIELDKVVFEQGNERRELRVQDDLVAAEDKAFIKAVRQGDPSLVYSDYHDALRTHRLCLDMVGMAT